MSNPRRIYCARYLAVQLEIMRQPLIEELEKQAQIPVWHALQKLPSQPRPKDQFDAKDLVLAAEAVPHA